MPSAPSGSGASSRSVRSSAASVVMVTVRVTVPLDGGVFGPISIRTAGGSSAAYATSLSSIASTALSGTPADAALASANAGQAVTLLGSGFSLDSDILLRFVDINGSVQATRLSPSAVAADGSSATLLIPREANGAFSLQMFGSASQPVLQIVPTLSSVDVQDRTVLFGSGFVEGSSVYSFAGSVIADSAADNATNNVDVWFSATGSVQNASAYINRTALPAHGLGNVSVRTAGGSMPRFRKLSAVSAAIAPASVPPLMPTATPM